MPETNRLQRMMARESILFVVLVMASTCLLTGCDKKPITGEVVGSVVFRGKPVYPGVVMLKNDSGKSYTAKLTAEGGFRVFEVEKGKYQVAIETIKLGSAGRAKPSAAEAKDAQADSSEFPNRELDVPDQYKNANINIPKKYNSFDTSGLEIDCSEAYPSMPVELKLK